jgi:5-methylcytosine-specific restriction endonuclease McrA
VITMGPQFWQISENKNDPEYKRFRLAILARDNYICQIRGSLCTYRANKVDHIIPVTRANMKDPLNCRAACNNCNAQKAAQDRAHRQGKARPMHRPRSW